MKELRYSRLNHRLRGAFSLTWKSLVTLIVAGMLVYFVEGIVSKLMPDHASGWDFLWAALLLVVLIFMIYVGQYERIASQISASVTTVKAEDIDEQRSCLICGYSPIKPDKETGEPRGPMALQLSTLSRNLDDVCDKNKRDGVALLSWQQNLRVLLKLKHIKHLYVLNPNLDQFARFKAVLRCFFDEERLKITSVTGVKKNPYDLGKDEMDKLTPDYENLHYVRMGIDRALVMIQKDLSVSAEEAEAKSIIDVTAGLKTFSIAAAIASLNRNLIFVYAGTEERTGEVLAYDADVHLFRQQTL